MTRKMRNKLAVSLVAVIFALGIVVLIPKVSHAVAMGYCVNQTEHLGSCVKTVEVVGNQLTITMDNISDASNGGFITADAFNLGAGVTATLTSSTNANFSLLSAPISVSPFGSRQFALASTSSWTGGGNPTGGIGVGDGVVTFELALGGNLANLLTEEEILLSQAVRFRGFVNGGSDKATVVPEPSALLLLGSGLAGVGLWQWRRKKRFQV